MPDLQHSLRWVLYFFGGRLFGIFCGSRASGEQKADCINGAPEGRLRPPRSAVQQALNRDSKCINKHPPAKRADVYLSFRVAGTGRLRSFMDDGRRSCRFTERTGKTRLRKEKTMWTCDRCGAQNTDGEAVCASCGASKSAAAKVEGGRKRKRRAVVLALVLAAAAAIFWLSRPTRAPCEKRMRVTRSPANALPHP